MGNLAKLYVGAPGVLAPPPAGNPGSAPGTHIETRVVQLTLISMVTLLTGAHIEGFTDVEAGTTVLTRSCVAGIVHITRVAVVTIQTLTSEGGVRLIETDTSVAVKKKCNH